MTALDIIRRLEGSLRPGESALVEPPPGGSAHLVECWERTMGGARVFVCAPVEHAGNRQEGRSAAFLRRFLPSPTPGVGATVRGFLRPHSERKEIAR